MHVLSRRQRFAWSAAGVIAGASTARAMYIVVSTFGRHRSGPQASGFDFANNTWRAVRDLVAGHNIYGISHELIPGLGPAFQPVSQHVPASLLWQAPFAAASLPNALFAFSLASIVTIWAAVFILVRPRTPSAILLTAACAAFAVDYGGGPSTLLIGQPSGFELLGLALVLRSRKPWLAGVGFMLAATTLQTGIPLALAMLVLGNWQIVWRGIVVTAACSLPPVTWEIANAGLKGFVYSFISGAFVHLRRSTVRIDLGGLLLRYGLVNVGAEIAISILMLALTLGFLARLPRQLRRLDYPPVLCLVIACCLLCTYHQPYDVLLVGGCVVPVVFLVDRSRAMLPAFGAAAIAAFFSTYSFGCLLDPIFLLVIGGVSAWAAWRAGRPLATATVSHESPPGGVTMEPELVGNPAGQAVARRPPRAEVSPDAAAWPSSPGFSVAADLACPAAVRGLAAPLLGLGAGKGLSEGPLMAGQVLGAVPWSRRKEHGRGEHQRQRRQPSVRVSGPGLSAGGRLSAGSRRPRRASPTDTSPVGPAKLISRSPGWP